MTEFYEAPGLPADWLNGWLAAVGVVVLLSDVRLSWSPDAIPIARFHGTDIGGLPERLVAAMPRDEELALLAIRAEGPGGRMGQSIDKATYRERACEAREKRDWSLGISHSDLGGAKDEKLNSAGPFNVGVEKGVTLWERLMKIGRDLGADRNSADLMRMTLQGTAPRVGGNGLAFDCRRLPSGVQPPGPMCQPFVELLAFSGISLFPVRGDGKHLRQRGWTSKPESFRYPVWSAELNSDAIDAFLDLGVWSARHVANGWYKTRSYKKSGRETRTGYYAERVR